MSIKRLIPVLLVITACSTPNVETFKVEGAITLKDTYAPLVKNLPYTKEIHLNSSTGGEIQYKAESMKFPDLEKIWEAQIPTRVTGVCKSSCAAIALHGSKITIDGGEICIHIGKNPGGYTIYNMNFYRLAYRGVSDKILEKVFTHAPKSYCLSSAELKTIDRVVIK